jgi:hypothetical protein
MCSAAPATASGPAALEHLLGTVVCNALCPTVLQRTVMSAVLPKLAAVKVYKEPGQGPGRRSALALKTSPSWSVAQNSWVQGPTAPRQQGAMGALG